MPSSEAVSGPTLVERALSMLPLPCVFTTNLSLPWRHRITTTKFAYWQTPLRLPASKPTKGAEDGGRFSSRKTFATLIFSPSPSNPGVRRLVLSGRDASVEKRNIFYESNYHTISSVPLTGVLARSMSNRIFAVVTHTPRPVHKQKHQILIAKGNSHARYSSVCRDP